MNAYCGEYPPSGKRIARLVTFLLRNMEPHNALAADIRCDDESVADPSASLRNYGAATQSAKLRGPILVASRHAYDVRRCWQTFIYTSSRRTLTDCVEIAPIAYQTGRVYLTMFL